MAKKPIHPTPVHMMHYYIHWYYMLLEKDDKNKIRKDVVTHYLLVEQIRESYESEVERRYPDWYSEDNLNYFKRNINWLTKVYDRYERYILLNKDKAALSKKIEKETQSMKDFINQEFRSFSEVVSTKSRVKKD